MSTRYRPRWPLLLALVVGVSVVVGLMYRTSGPSGEALPTHAGNYVEGIAGTPIRINPLFITNDAEADLSALVFSGLVRLGPKGDIQGDLAEDWTIGPDGREYTFRLRNDASWHDGSPLDAEDVLFTIRSIQDPDFTEVAGDPRLADLFRGVEIEALDAQTVIMTLPEPFAPFLAYTTVGILPEHRLGNLAIAEIFDAPFNDRPIGSGPFRVAERTSTSVTLQSFDGYHLDRPLLEQLELRFYRDDATLLNALRDGEVDGALLHASLTPTDVTALDEQARWVRRSLHTTTYSLIYLNPRVPAFADDRVRRALQHGLDREALIGEALAGQAIAIDSPIARDLWAYVGSPEAFAFDPVLAADLLDEAGWTLSVDGRSKEDEPLRFVLATIDDPAQIQVASAIARQWSELGIQVDVQKSGASRFREETLLSRDFDAVLSTIRPPGPDPDPYPFWHSSQSLGDGLNLSSFSSPESDQLLENARLSPSQEQRFDDYQNFQELFAQELPAVLLYTPTYQYYVRTDVQGVVSPELLLTLSSRFYDVHRWFVETAPAADDVE